VSVGQAERRRLDYADHLGSAAWRDCPARHEELHLSGHRCRICDRGPPLVKIEVHHRTYERFGAERVEDLTTLCRECHVVVTDALRRRRHAAAALPLLVDTPRVLPRRTIGDTMVGRTG
jgi:5-methylcytosine-specific restriction endonuclease McrA